LLASTEVTYCVIATTIPVVGVLRNKDDTTVSLGAFQNSLSVGGACAFAGQHVARIDSLKTTVQSGS
jgi:hypothetical protein